MRVPHGMNGELPQPGTERLQFGLRLPQGSVEGKLITLIERRKIHGFDRLVELLITLPFILLVSVQDRPRGKDFFTQPPGIGTAGGRLDQQLCLA